MLNLFDLKSCVHNEIIAESTFSRDTSMFLIRDSELTGQCVLRGRICTHQTLTWWNPGSTVCSNQRF